MVRFDILAAPFFAACSVLVASGLSKLRATEPTRRALYASGLPSGRTPVLALGLLELAIGIAGFAAPTPPVAAAIAVAFASFGAFLAWLLLHDVPGASCGCAGTRDLPPSWLHVSLDALAALVALGVATTASAANVWTFARAQPVAGIPFVLGTALIAWLAALTVAYAPALFTSYRGRVHA
jgi:hypothetical protein